MATHMKFRIRALLSVGAIGLALAPNAAFAASRAAPIADLPFTTPAGITVTSLGEVRGKDGILRVGNNRKTTDIYADSRGMTLYTYDKDVEPGKSTCDGECAAAWPAAVPVAAAKATGAWSLTPRADGTKQWAYYGKPVYTFAKDEQPGDKKGSVENTAWKVLSVKAPETTAYPFGITLRDLPDAGGQVLVDSDGKALYAYSGDLKQERAACYAMPCGSNWIVLAAPAITKAVGEFSVAIRPDGSRQWAFRGRPLYRFSGDMLGEDVNGSGVDKRWQPALVARYPVPAEVKIVSTPSNGKIFAAADGKTLYRYSFYQRVQSSDDLRAGPYVTAIGQALGTRACEAECLKAWRPLAAPTNAQPSWHWTILTREDGTRQWAYRGHALYTYVEDKKPGDLMGLNSWDIAVNDKDLHTVSVLAKISADNQLPSAFYWTTAYP